MREREIRIRQRLADHLARLLLVARVEIGVQEAHRDRLDAFVLERAAGVLDAGAAQRLVHVAGGEHALVDLAREAARHQRTMAVEQEVVRLGAVAAADDVHVAGAAGDDQPGLRALALDQRVDGDGRAVDQLVDRGRFDAALAQAVDDALHQLGGRGETLGLHECAGLGIKAEQVGEGPPDIDGDDKHARVPPKRGAGR